MSYAVKEIYYTLQGEGVNAGRAAVFLRFAGCNLWSGRDDDRERGAGGCARWCDTDFVGTDGVGGGRFSGAADLADAALALWPTETPGRPFVVCTGGEPALQLDAMLIEELHNRGFEVAIETNGTRPLPGGIDWICVSPKAGPELVVRTGNELKLVYPQPEGETGPERYQDLAFAHFLLQPLDGPDRARNTQLALAYCLSHTRWRLSLQTHKYLGIP